MIRWRETPFVTLNALVAEHVMDWKWINFDYYDVTSVEHQLWLLPDVMATKDIRPGEWTWYDEDRLGQDSNRILPYWIPNYVSDMNAAAEVMRRFTVPVTLTYSGTTFTCKIVPVLAEDEPVYGLSKNPAEAVCRAALRAVGKEISLGH